MSTAVHAEREQEEAEQPRGAEPAQRPQSSILALQRAAGNQAVTQLLARECGCSGDCCGSPGAGGGAAAAGQLPVDPQAELERIAGAAEGATSPEQLEQLAAEATVYQELAQNPPAAGSSSPTVARMLARAVQERQAPSGPVVARLPAFIEEGIASLGNAADAATGAVADLGAQISGLVDRAKSRAGEIAQEVSRSRGTTAAFCRPYSMPTELPLALADKAFLLATLPATATAMFGTSEIGAIWLQFLAGGSPTRRSYSGAGNAIVDGFARAEVTAAEQELILDEIEAAFTATPPALTGTGETEIDVTSLGIRLDRDVNWSNAFDIPGHIAGGQSGGAGGADTRKLSGKVHVSQRPQLDGTTTLIIRTALVMDVNDTVDFCPGGAGAGLEQALTVPLSRLEATGTGWAVDVPFDVKFQFPTLTRTAGGGWNLPTAPGRSPHSGRERAGQVRGRDDGVRREEQPDARVR